MKKDKLMVSLNPEFGIELEAILKVAERVKDTRPELHSILSTVAAVILAGDEKTLLKYCNNYVTDKLHGDKFYGDLKTALGYYIDLEKEDKKKPPPFWFPPFEDDEL